MSPDGMESAETNQERDPARPAGRQGLETYGRILRLLEDRPIQLALYFPLFPDWRVWDYPT